MAHGLTWSLPNDYKIICLTFDYFLDEKATPYVLDILNDFKANVSFCSSRNGRKK